MRAPPSRPFTARGRVPLLVGGTMLYLRALRDGLALLPPASAALRRELDAQAASDGWPALHAELERVDAAAAARIARNDAQRIQRALEVHRLDRRADVAMATQYGGRARGISLVALCAAAGVAARAGARHLGARFDAMLGAGLVEEVRALYARGDLTEQHPADARGRLPPAVAVSERSLQPRSGGTAGDCCYGAAGEASADLVAARTGPDNATGAYCRTCRNCRAKHTHGRSRMTACERGDRIKADVFPPRGICL